MCEGRFTQRLQWLRYFFGCSLSYLDFRFAHLDWRKRHPQITAWHASFAQRPSAKATEPVDD
jgi:glutathione S-transferase